MTKLIPTLTLASICRSAPPLPSTNTISPVVRNVGDVPLVSCETTGPTLSSKGLFLLGRIQHDEEGDAGE